ncbi:MAG: transketolase, partial [candidate division Zixibacteria bacterium]|nr:transketolase [candidate division Zixibacteria bacterium]
LTFWADFGVFGIAETYNQNRLNDINEANLKVVCTHCGLDVGEDGKTHQSIDYFALSRSVFGWKLLTPADPNQTDRITRYIASLPGNFLMVMGRSKINPISNSQGDPFFGADYKFRPDRTDEIRDGEGATIVCAGAVLGMGLEAWERLSESGKNVRLISAAHWADFHLDDLREICEFGKIVTVEDHNVNTGFGMSLSSELFSAGLAAQIVKIGVTRYGSSGKAVDLYKLMGIDGESIASKTLALLENTTPVENKINSSVVA